jgi:cytochrome c-type biogenesis protein CcmF
MFNNLVLLGACFAVLCGTLFPLLTDAVLGHKITVGPPFFNKVVVPIGLFLIFLTGVGPLLAWRSTSWGSVKRNFALPAGISLVVTWALVIWNIRPWQGFSRVREWANGLETAQVYSWITFLFSALVIATIASEFIRGGRVLQGKLNGNLFTAMYHLTRRNMRRYGGYVVHFGFILVMIGIAGLAFNQDKEQEMGLGDKLQIGHYTLVGQSYTQDDNANYQSDSAILDIYKDGKFLGTLYPELRFYKASGGQPDHKVADYSTLAEDLYVIYEGPNPQTERPIIKAFVNPLVSWVWIGVLVVMFGTMVALVPNAQQIRSTVPVPASVAVKAMAEQGLEPARVGE